jgi:phosphohistidine swiveling domain-containing protein
MSQSITGNRPIPTPQGFPLQWANPADANLLWVYSPAYYPKPMLPLEFDLGALPPILAGNRVFARHGAPFQTRACLLNGYLYNTTFYASESMSAESSALPEWDEREIIPLITNLRQRWERQWLPAIKEHLAAWQGFALTSATMPALSTHLNASVERIDHLQEMHSEVAVAFFTAIQHFEAWVQATFTPETGEKVDAYTLLAGFESTGSTSSQALWQLSRLALMEPEVYWVLGETPVEQITAALHESDEGQEFLTALQAYLQRYGYQGDKNYLSQPTWAEDPTPVLQLLRGYLAQSQRDLTADLQATSTRREAALATIRQRISSLPHVDSQHFEFLLQAAQDATWLREEHPHWLDLRLYAETRRVLLEIGRRFAQTGVLAASADIFYLTLEEVRQTMSQAASQQSLVAQRRARHKENASYTPPTLLGAFPAQPPPNHPLLAVMAQNTAELSLAQVSKPTPSPTPLPLTGSGNEVGVEGVVLRGHAASAGCVRGRARLTTSPAEASNLRAGDILVTVNTTPAWTSIYANIAGLVTDTGGILSHAAVVAREFGIPAVVGTRAATALIKDGQWIEVNGSKGVVRVITQ